MGPIAAIADSEQEKAYLRGLPAILGLRPEEVARLHAQLGAPRGSILERLEGAGLGPAEREALARELDTPWDVRTPQRPTAGPWR